MSSARSVIAAIAVSTASFVAAPGSALAQPSGQDVATAQALFDEGKRLMGTGKYAEACPKLVESQRIDPGGGTLFAIALCHESEGKTATAWADFNVAAAEARKDHRADREAAAVEHVRALVPKLTRVRVAPQVKVTGLEIRRDGSRVGEAQWGTPLPIDPGDHVFEASAPGRTTWRQRIDVHGEGATVDVSVPSLAEDTTAPAPPPAAPAPPPAEPRPPSPPEESRGGQKTWALVAGGLGIAAAAVGLGFGISASSRWKDADRRCPGGRCADPHDVTLARDAGNTADIATVLLLVGAAGVATGTVLWLTAPAEPSSQRSVRVVPSVSTQSFGVALRGTL
jgi:serine/threonine-protein kinase